MTPVSSTASSRGRRLAGVAAVALGGVLAAGALAGCSDPDDADDPGASETPSASSGESTGASDATDATASTDTAVPSSYLPVPTGVTLTAPGTALGLGDSATVAWRPRQDRVVALDLTVDRIDETSFAESFDGWVVTPQMKGQTPYFVRVKATNESDADAGGLLVPLYAQAGATSMYEPLSFQEKEFAPCPGGVLPEHLMPGESADLCFVYLLPEGARLRSAAFDLVGELQPITWTGTITAIEKPGKDKGKKKKDDKGGAGEQAG